MKKYILFFTIIITFLFSLGNSYAGTLEKKYIVKGLILAKVDLVKNSNDGNKYVATLDEFFIKYPGNSEKMQNLLKRIPTIRTKLGNSTEHKNILRIINYIEYKAAYLSIKTITTPDNPTPRDIKNTATLNEISTLSTTMDTLTASGSITLKEIIWEEISSRTGTGSEWIIGYPNYSTLGILKNDYNDSFGNEYFVVYHFVTDSVQWAQYYYQILGYTQTDNNKKTAIIKWNYSPINSSYPASLFVDIESKNTILDGDVFSIK